MIKKIELSGVHLDIDKKLQAYTMKKIGKLDKYLPRHARESANAEIFLKESKSKKNNQQTCKVVLELPKEVIIVEESTMNIYAAVDIVEAKLKNRIRKYKETHSSLRIHKRVLSKIRRKTR